MNLDLISGASIAAVTSLVVCRALIASGPVDAPNAPRKAHRAPTPTSGGLAIAFGFSVGLAALAFFSHAVREDMSARGVGLLTFSVSFAYAFLIVGFIDDAHPLSARLKLVLFSVLGLGAAATVGVVTDIPIADGVTLRLPLWLGLIGTALWIFTMVNCVNFMDGANGLAMGATAIGMGALGFIASAGGSGAGAAIGFCVLGALIGFLFWNFPRGKLFAGDSGALFIGALAALSSVLAVHRIGLSPIVPVIVFFPLLSDALLTLAWRAIRRRSLFDGHSEHIYQIAIHGGMSHAEVASIYWAASIFCAAIGYVAAKEGGAAPAIALASLSIAAVVVSTIVRRFAGRSGVSGV